MVIRAWRWFGEYFGGRLGGGSVGGCVHVFASEQRLKCRDGYRVGGEGLGETREAGSLRTATRRERTRGKGPEEI